MVNLTIRIMIVLLGTTFLSYAEGVSSGSGLYASTQGLSPEAVEALNLAINDEYRARATYQKVIEEFGEIKPFINIIEAEGRHVAALQSLFDKYQLNFPKDDLYNTVPAFDSVLDACQAGVEAEIRNIKLYDELFLKINNEDISRVFKNLQRASGNHLRAFERCVQRNEN